jgi:hypothetical protein
MKQSEVDISLNHVVMASFTPQVTPTLPTRVKLGQSNGISVQPYALETAYQWPKHFVYI